MIRGSGFIAALIAGPETVKPSEFYPEVFGGEIGCHEFRRWVLS